MSEKELFVDFVQDCAGFDDRTKMRLLQVGLGVKPATYARLKITTKNLRDKHHFESHLRALGLVFEVSAPKGFEEIDRVTRSKVVWSMRGTWYGYDVFKGKKEQALFAQYRKLALKDAYLKADETAARLYGYPACCMRAYAKEQDVRLLAKKYSAFGYFKSHEERQLRFPLLSHVPCSPSCASSRVLSARYVDALRRFAPKWFAQFSKVKRVRTKLLVDHEADVFTDETAQRSVWLEKDGHQYRCISLSRVQGAFVALAYVQRNSLEIGTVFDAEVRIAHGLPQVKKRAVVDFFFDVDHERRFTIVDE